MNVVDSMSSDLKVEHAHRGPRIGGVRRREQRPRPGGDRVHLTTQLQRPGGARDRVPARTRSGSSKARRNRARARLIAGADVCRRAAAFVTLSRRAACPDASIRFRSNIVDAPIITFEKIGVPASDWCRIGCRSYRCHRHKTGSDVRDDRSEFVMRGCGDRRRKFVGLTSGIGAAPRRDRGGDLRARVGDPRRRGRVGPDGRTRWRCRRARHRRRGARHGRPSEMYFHDPAGRLLDTRNSASRTTYLLVHRAKLNDLLADAVGRERIRLSTGSSPTTSTRTGSTGPVRPTAARTTPTCSSGRTARTRWCASACCGRRRAGHRPPRLARGHPAHRHHAARGTG